MTTTAQYLRIILTQSRYPASVSYYDLTVFLEQSYTYIDCKMLCEE